MGFRSWAEMGDRSSRASRELESEVEGQPESCGLYLVTKVKLVK